MGQTITLPPHLGRMIEHLGKRLRTLETSLPSPLTELGDTGNVSVTGLVAATPSVWAGITDTDVTIVLNQPAVLLVMGSVVFSTNNAAGATYAYLRLQSDDLSWIDTMWAQGDNDGKIKMWTHHPVIAGASIAQPGTATLQWGYTLNGGTTQLNIEQSEIRVYAVGAVGL